VPNKYATVADLIQPLGIQNAPATPYPIPFEYLDDYKITAEQDRVEIWEDLISGHLEYDDNHRLFRGGSKRWLPKGRSITVSGSTQPLVSEDRSVDGKTIKRVRVSNDGFSAIFPNPTAEFVNLEQVRITCVPSSLAKANEAFSDLPEISYEEDPPS
jgi:hypothetical protein